MTDKIWWPSKPDDADNSHKEKVDQWIAELDEAWNDTPSYPVLADDHLDKVFIPEDQPNDFVQVGIKDCTTRSWLISNRPIQSHDGDSRVIYDNVEDFV